MADCSKNKNPLIRNGTNRSQRLIDALGENYVVPDENQIEHWLVYARDLAMHIKYYTIENKKSTDDWQAFFDADVSAQLALITTQNVDDFKDRIRALLNHILSTDLQSDLPALRKTFGLLFSAVFTLVYRLDHFSKVLREEVPLKRTITNLAATRLASATKRLLAYYKAAAEFYIDPLVMDEQVDGWTILAFPQEKLSVIIEKLKKELSSNWIFKSASAATTFESYYNTDIIIDKTVYDHPASAIANADVWRVINHAANHNLFTSLFAEFISAYAKVVADARTQLLETITNQSSHEPYYALYLTFLHLFKFPLKDLNRFTGRHFDFYYQDVLRLKAKPSEPNHVHLLLELATNMLEFEIKKGVAFKAGKDSLGKEVIYTSDKDVVINKALVSELRSFYRATSLDKIGTAVQEGLIYGSSVAASADGAGAKLVSESKDWHPFANKIFIDGKLSTIAMPECSIGFGLASHYLFLKEGKRSVAITIKGQAINKLMGKEFTCYYTSEKKWEEKICPISVISSVQAFITIDISASDPPVTALDPKVHIDNYEGVDTPFFKFVLKNVRGKNQYEDLKETLLSEVSLTVRCGELDKYTTAGIKELFVSTDFGSVDPSKPFFPYGQNPKAGMGLVIGNKEIFSKRNSKLTLSFSWAELEQSIQDMDVNLTDIFFPTAQVKFLQNGVWVDGVFKSLLNAEHVGAPKDGEVEIFWGRNSVMLPDVYVASSSMKVPDEAVVDYKEDFPGYTISSQAGFVKVQLNHDFQFEKYFMDLQLFLIAAAKSTSPGDPPVEPYTPKLHSLHVSYESSVDLKFNDISDQSPKMFHLYPFGYKQIDMTDVVSDKVKLLPQFVHQEGFNVIPNIAEFYIGLKAVTTPQRVELLIKVLDGSTDPLRSKPDQHVFWSYLSANHWIDFKKEDINDGTRQLIETGIISVPIPDAATNTNTVLPAGLHWLKASIKEMPEQVCRLIDVRAQALQATFADQQNAEDFLKAALAANIISKLKLPDSAVKKVEQPYSPFGGRYKETSTSFRVRVSERLRHKNRAITIRDYEQLVLEHFPDIHKVKCLNHTRLELKETTTLYNEQAAGFVTVITIPDLRNKNAINPLRPYTSRNKLEEIRDFLLDRSNCNATLFVENPAFEEVRIETKIVLRDAFAGNDGFYSDKLKQDILAFLTPWAFDINTDISFGGRITKSELINFIEEREYVDFILELLMFHNKMDGSSEVKVIDEIRASTARSVLVSAPVASHLVTVLAKPKKVDIHKCD